MLDNLMDQSFYEFPSFQVALVSLLLAFVLSTVVAFTYKLTYRGIGYSGSFFQAMILSSIATATIIMAVGNNVAVGFGIIGAIAIIRFRTRISEPRNIIFIFASIGVGIAAGVYGYAIAVSGTIIFCLVAFLLHFSTHNKSSLFLYSINFSLTTIETMPAVKAYLNENCDTMHLMSINERKVGDERFEFQITLKDHVDHQVFFRNLRAIEGVENLRLTRKENVERL